jgi:hypothetical protein
VHLVRGTLFAPCGVHVRHFGALFMNYDAHQPVIDDLEARIATIRDSL